MSKTIDQKVVEMRFDNKNFENNAKQSMSTLDKLKQKLNFNGMSKGLEKLNTSANKVNMNGLSGALDNVSSRFSAMEVVGITALANITNSAVNAGKRIVSALTIDPIKTGFKEYETQINAVQTILANTQKEGTNIQMVNAALDELNLYADKTIYNFTEMTRNIGTFTAAGVKLETSVNAIKGIANLAAVSGSTSQQASTAMYQLSQALAAGKVQLMDWNSVVNAGMGGQVFQDALIRTSELLGTGAKQAIATYGSFRESLTKSGWLTTEVLNETLSQFAGAYDKADLMAQGYSEAQADEIVKMAKTAEDAATKVKTFTQLWDVLKEAAQSGWAQTWRIIVGDFEEAKALFTPLADFLTNIINGFSEARNKLLESALGRSFTGLISGLEKSSNNVKKIVDSVKDYAAVVDEIILGKWGNGQQRWDKLTEEGYDWAHAQNLVNERLGVSLRRATDYKEVQDEVASSQEKTNELTTDYIIKLTKMSDAQLKNKGYTDKQIKSLRELTKVADQTGIPLKDFINNIDQINGRYLLMNSFKNIGLSLVNIFSSIGKAWRNAFPPMSGDTLFNIIAGLHKFTAVIRSKVEKNADKLTRTLQGLFAILDLISMVVGGGLKIAFNILKAILGAFNIDVLEFTARIGDAIVTFRDWIEENNLITKGIQKLASYIVIVVKAIKDWIANNETIANGIEKIKSKLSAMSNAMKEWMEGLKETDNVPQYILSGLVNGIKNGIGFVTNAFIELGKGIIAAIKGVLGIHSPSTEFFTIGKNIIQGLINGIQNGASAVFGALKGLAEGIIEIFQKIDFGKILAAAIGVGMLVVVKNIIDVIQSLSDLAYRVTAPLQGIGDLLTGLGTGITNFSKGYKISKQGKAIRDIAIAIGILAGSVYLLSKIKPGTLWATIGAIAALAAIIGVLGFAASKMNEIHDLGKASLTFIGITASLFILASTLSKLSKIEPERMKSVIAGFTAIVIGLGALIAAFGLFVTDDTAKNMDKAAKLIGKIGLTLLLVVVAIKLLSGLDAGDVAKGIITFGLLGGLFAALTVISQFSGEHADKAGKMMRKMATAMLVAIVVIKLASMLDGEDIIKGIAVMGLIGTLFAALVAVSHLAGEHATKAGIMMLLMSVALGITVGVLKLAASLSLYDIAKSIPVVTALGVLFAGLIAVSKLAGQNAIKAGSMLLMMSGSLLILTGVLFILSKIDTAGLVKATAIVSVLEIIFGGLIAVSALAGDSIKQLVTITVAITLLIAAVIGLSFIDPQRLSAAAFGLTGVMTALGILIASTKLLGNSSGLLKKILPLVGVITALSGVLILLSKVKPSSALASATALSLLLVTLSASLVVMSLIGPVATSAIPAIAALTLVVAGLAAILVLMDAFDITASMETAKSLSLLLLTMSGVLVILGLVGAMGPLALIGVGAMALLTLVMAGLAVVLGIMNNMDATPSLETAKALSLLLTSMSASLVILGVVGLMGPAAFVGVAALMTLITSIGILLTAIGALTDKFPALETFLNKGIPILQKIGYALGSFVGNIVGGFISGVMGSLPSVGTSLSQFMVNATPFIVGIKMVDDKVVDGVGNITKAVLLLTAANLISGIASFLSMGSSFSDLGRELSKFMTNASGFINGSSKINPKTMNSIKTLAEAVKLLTTADLIEGISSWLTGDSSLSEFGTELSKLGTSMSQFADNLGTFDQKKLDTVNCASKALKALAEAASVIPNEGGLWASIVGDNSLASFGSSLSTLGTNIRDFVTNLGTFNEDQVTTVNCAAKAIKALAQAASEIPNEGGLWAGIVGDNSLAKFGSGLADLGTNMKNFVTNLGTFNEDQVTTVNCASKAIKTLAKAANEIPNEGGLWAKLAGDNSLAKFGKNLPGLGSNIKDFVKNLGEFSEEKVITINAACKAIKTIAKLGEIDIKDTGKNLGTFGKNMVDLAGYIKSFVSSLGDVGNKGINSGIKKTKELIQMCKTVASVNVSSLKTFGKSLKSVATDGVKGFVNGLSGSNPTSKAKTATKTLIKFALDGAEEKKSDVKKKFRSVAKEAINGLNDQDVKSQATSIGRSFVQGFANGINNNVYLARDAGSAVGRKALSAAKRAIDSNSPSKETFKLGTFFDQGFVLGIEKMHNKIYNAAYSTGDHAKSGLRKAISKISDVINSDMDTQPTIRPVLDLSDVQTGANYLSAMFNHGPSVGLTANLNSINSRMNARNQNGANDDVVSAIDKLRKDIGNVRGTTYNVNGITYDDGSNISDAVETLIRAAVVEGRK